jgi:hypothetical protein
MNDLTYGAPAILAWAEFSGDFNPVHFDVKRAAALGLRDVPVHGMRVMLDIKSVLFNRAVLPHPLFYKAALRSPVLRGGRYSLSVEAKKNGQTYALVDALDQRVCITGMMRPASPEQLSAIHGAQEAAGAIPWHSFVITRAELIDAAARFAACEPESSEPWLLLDALLFSKLLGDAGLFIKAARHMSGCGLASADELMQRAVVLQTHHSTLIPEAVQRLSLSADGGFAGIDVIDCRIHEPIIDGNAADGFVFEVSLDAWARDILLLRTTVGLRISF